MTDRVGQQLGNYRLIRLLGKGGFAEVYLGEHVYLETQAAIKVLLTQLASEDMEPFRLEAKRVAHLEHPHIVRVLEFGVDGTTPYLAMSYAPSGTLRQRHPKGVALPLPTILGYVKQIADALQYAHDEHFIHRDVKPENLLVGRRQEILLSDFGIALLSQTSRSQSMQDVAGTASYMAPEQFEGKPRPASDQYSLGIIVYEWLTGDRPFHGSSFREIASQHLFVPPPPLHERMVTISPTVERVVMTALAKDPKQRFSQVQAFADALEQASQVEVSRTIPASRSPQPTDAPTTPSSSQPSTELAASASQSSIPTELVTPVNKLSIPTERSAPANPSLLPTELADQRDHDPGSTVAPSNALSSPPETMTPPSQLALSMDVIASATPSVAKFSTQASSQPWYVQIGLARDLLAGIGSALLLLLLVWGTPAGAEVLLHGIHLDNVVSFLTTIIDSWWLNWWGIFIGLFLLIGMPSLLINLATGLSGRRMIGSVGFPSLLGGILFLSFVLLIDYWHYHQLQIGWDIFWAIVMVGVPLMVFLGERMGYGRITQRP